MFRVQCKSWVQKIYDHLFKAFGPQHWWPAETPFEVMVGAILTQNTNWKNVEKALNNLKERRLLTAGAIHHLPLNDLAALIKPAGYFNIKAKRLKSFINFFVDKYAADIHKMKQEPFASMRHQLLNVNGIGPETADSMLLYALDQPVFVVDAYTKRFLYRHNLIKADAAYHSVQELFMGGLDHDLKTFNEYHALIVRLGKDYCRPHPACEVCPLKDVHYCLIHRCSHCYRALPEPRGRRRWKVRVPGEDTPGSNGHPLRFLCPSCQTAQPR